MKVVSSLAPIMEDARVAGATPAAPSTTASEATSAPQVIVRTPDGTPIPNATVQLVRVLDGDTPQTPKEDFTGNRTATTGADGKATFSSMAPMETGRYRVVPTSYSSVSSRSVDFTVAPPVVTPPVVTPPVVTPPVVTPPVVTPPVVTPPTVQVRVKSVNSGNKLHVDVNPNMGQGHWTFKVQYKDGRGQWKTYRTTYKTFGNSETNTLNLRRGTYRVVVNPKYGYEGTTSYQVYLRR